MLLVAIVVFVVTGPFRKAGDQELVVQDRRAELEAEKESKYREIRDAELDYRMGKLSEEDFKRTDGELRTQAIAILKDLDSLDAR